MSLPCKWQYVIIDPTERPLSPLQLLFCGRRQLADSLVSCGCWPCKRAVPIQALTSWDWSSLVLLVRH